MIENFADVGYDGNSSVHTRCSHAAACRLDPNCADSGHRTLIWPSSDRVSPICPYLACAPLLLLFSFLLCLSLCSMFMAPYDWRLSFRHMQLRDFFFTKVRLCNENAWSTAFSSIKLSPLSRADSFPFLRFVCGLYLHCAAQVHDRNRQARQPQSVSGDTVGPTR